MNNVIKTKFESALENLLTYVRQYNIGLQFDEEELANQIEKAVNSLAIKNEFEEVELIERLYEWWNCNKYSYLPNETIINEIESYFDTLVFRGDSVEEAIEETLSFKEFEVLDDSTIDMYKNHLLEYSKQPK